MALADKTDSAQKWLEKGFLFPFARSPLQVVQWSQKRVGASFTGASQALTLPADTDIIEISSTEHCYINFGTSGAVTATTVIASDASRLFVAGVQVIPVPINPATGTPFTHMAVISAGVNGVIQVEKVQ